VLTISQEMENIQSVPSEAKGLVGMVEFQDNAVPVLDFANLLGFPSGVEKLRLLCCFAIRTKLNQLGFKPQKVAKSKPKKKLNR